MLPGRFFWLTSRDVSMTTLMSQPSRGSTRTDLHVDERI